MNKPFNLEEIEWLDHASYGDGWESVEDIVKHSTPVRVRTVGWVAEETKDYVILLVGNLTNEDDTFVQKGSKSITILKNCIINRWSIR